MATLDADDLNAIAALITTNVAAIKAKTDQLTFLGGYANANVRSITDVEGNQRSITSPGGSDGDPITIHQLAAATIADAVWDELLSGHVTSGSAGAKLSLIGTGSALVASPVSAAGELTNPIIAGDDYLAANGRAFEFTVAEPTGFVAATSTAKFGGEALNGTADSWLSTGTITDNGSTWLLKFDLTKTQTAALSEGLYKWSVELTNASGTEHTVVRWGEEAKVVDKQT